VFCCLLRVDIRCRTTRVPSACLQLQPLNATKILPMTSQSGISHRWAYSPEELPVQALLRAVALEQGVTAEHHVEGGLGPLLVPPWASLQISTGNSPPSFSNVQNNWTC